MTLLWQAEMAHYHSITPELTVADVENFFSMNVHTKKTVRKQLPDGVYKGRCYDPDPEKNNMYCQTTTLRSNFELLEENEDDEEVDDVTSVDPYGSLISGDMETLEVETLPPMRPLNDGVAVEERRLTIYEHYNFQHTYNNELPINTHMTEILETISGYPVTIIQGATGSGKTTQVPQFLLDEAARERKYCNIVITQPRKIAAMSLARRVCTERGWELGYVVGYHVGLDKKTSEDTRITYVTTGVLLQQLIKAKDMHRYTHVILDEVHERDQDTDFAMLLVRKLLWQNSMHVKVILMSATLETEVFADYFGSPVSGSCFPAPKLTVDGRMFAVEEHYIEELAGLGELPKFVVANPEISEETYLIAAKLIIHLDALEKEEREAEAGNGETAESSAQNFRGSVLVFLPGLFQIREMEERLNYHRVAKQWTVIPLHSSITLEEQYLVFKNPKPGYRKIILSTNIAESSITVPDIKYVIDFCLTKAMVCDLDTNYQSLRLQWASKASGKQRAGRAGRVSKGKVYRLVKREFWDYELDEYAVPEMQRCSLESVILKVKMLDLGDPKSILSLALSPPDMHNIERTILLLKEIGALSTAASKKRFDGQLTFVGRVLATLPIDMHLGKLVMLGYAFGCFNDCVIIAAALSKPSFFATPYNLALNAYKKKLFWAKGSFSDCIALLNAYKKWYRCSQTQVFLRSADEKRWCTDNYLQYRRLHEVHHQVEELKNRLHHFNIRSDDSDYWSETESSEEQQFILKVVMAGAFYPNYFLQSVSDEASAVKEMSQLDPARHIMFSGLPYGKAFLFKDSLLKLTKQCGKQKAIYYDGSKAFVEFESSDDIDTGNVLPAVYVASKIRSVKRRHEVWQTYAEVLNASEVAVRAPTFVYENLDDDRHSNEVPKPGSEAWFPIQVTYLVSATCFWGNKLLPRNADHLTQLAVTIHGTQPAGTRLTQNDIFLGELVLAPFHDGSVVDYYRALVTKIQPSITVWFVDYGNSISNLAVKDLRKLPDSIRDIPYQAIKFRLRGLRRNESIPAHESKQFLHSKFETVGYIANAQIYSVVSDVVCVDLFTNDDENINDVLLQNQFCEPVEEGKVSQISHSSWVLAKERNIFDAETFNERFHNQWTKVNSSIRGSRLQPGSGKVLSVFAPRTTYEETFTSCINIGRLRNVSVDINSLNSVCLNQNASNPKRTMMVAGEVGINQTGSTMLARNTTLMPNINGLYHFICVLFAPIVEFRLKDDQTCITGAICGLGAAKTRSGLLSVLPDHDIEVQFDTEFPLDEVTKINGIRMAINLIVGGENERASWGQRAIHEMQKHIRKRLLNLLMVNRPLIEPIPFRRPYTWGLMSDEFTVDHCVKDEAANLIHFYRLHKGTLLRDKQDTRAFAI